MSDFTQYIDQKLVPAVRQRQDLERRIVDEIAKALIGRGYVIRVYEGEDWATKRTTDPVVIQKAIMSTDEDHFFVYRPNEPERIGTVSFYYGNSGHDVVHDYSTVFDSIVDPICKKYN